MKKLKTSLVVLVLFFMASAPALGEAISFSPSWTLKTKTGQSIEITEIEADKDINGRTLFIYKTTEGKEGFVDASNFANSAELIALLKGTPLPETGSTNKQKPKKERKKESSIEVQNVWHEYGTTYILVKYTNETDRVFNNAVSIKCATIDRSRKIINTNERSFFAHEYGPIGPGFSNSVKIPVNDIEGKKVRNVNCTLNEW